MRFDYNTYDYTNQDDIIRLANDLDDLYITIRANILSQIWAKKLMVPKGLLMRLLFRFVIKPDKNDGAIANLMFRDAKVLKPAWNDFIDHLINGTDTSDPKSAGGYNASEIDQILDIVKKYV